MNTSPSHLITQPTQIYLSENEIVNYARYGSTNLDISQVEMNSNGKSPWHGGRLLADLYSVSMRALESISPVAGVWIKYYDKAPKIFFASKRLDKSGKTNIPESAVRIESGRTLDSIEFMIRNKHPNLLYDRPVELSPKYK